MLRLKGSSFVLREALKADDDARRRGADPEPRSASPADRRVAHDVS
jgi:hypothetical protein